MRPYKFLIVTFIFAISLVSSIQADVLSDAKSIQAKENAHDQSREQGFAQTEAALKKKIAQLQAKRKSLQSETDKLTDTFSDNEEKLAGLEEKLRLETGSLGEVFGVVRQNAKELQSHLASSITSPELSDENGSVDQIVAESELPSIEQLTGLWKAFEGQIIASRQIADVTIPLVNSEGQSEQVNAKRVGLFALIGKDGYYSWDSDRQVARTYLSLPDSVPTLVSVSPLVDSGLQQLEIDPSKGEILSQLAQSPTLQDRFEAGGIIGKIIVGLLAIGLIIALVRGVSLFWSSVAINRQLKTPNNIKNNALGRILSVYQSDKARSVEALELRLLECVVDEQAKLERGLSMLKLFAALAPMLGLLGTVTGMIETFQVITQFGNGDPKVMADGISMALVTTVLGLVAAMPLLFAHNVLSSKAESVRTILEKQGIGLVAQQAERDSKQSANPELIASAA